MNKILSTVVAVMILALGHQGLTATTNLVSNVLVVTNQCKTIVTYTMETNGTARVNDPTGRLIGTAEEAALRVAAEGQGAIASAAQVAAESARWEWDAFIATNDTHIVYIDAGFEQDLPALATNFCGWVASSFYDREKGEDHYYVWFNRELDYPPSMSARIRHVNGTNWLDGAWVDWNVTNWIDRTTGREWTRPYSAEVEYLENLGSSYIDTGVKPTDRDVISVGIFRGWRGGVSVIVGSRNPGPDVSIWINGGVYGCHWPIPGNWDPDNPPININENHVITLRKGALLLDGNLDREITTTYEFSNGDNLFLFALNNNSKPDSRFYRGGVRGLCIKRDGGIVIDFVPVLDLSGRPAMYDRVSGRLFYNQGTGEFTYGPITAAAVPCRELVVPRRNANCVLKTGTTITLGGKDGFNADIHNVNIEVAGTPTATTAVSAPFYAVTIDGTNRVVTAYTNGFVNVENGFIKEPTVDPSPVPPAPPAFGGLKFTAEESYCQLSINPLDPPELSLMYSLDNGLTFEVYEGDDIILLHKGDSVCFKAGPCGNETIRRSFTINSGYVSASGNVNSLLSEDYASVTNIGYGCYEGLFQYCTDLVSAPEICSDSFDWYACIMMFDGCRNLTNTPALTVSRAGDSCFKSMFRGCTSLKSAQPIIFTAPIEGSEVCMGMFEGCTSLESSPLIDFDSFGGGTYGVSRVFEQMFRDCRSLNEIKLTYAGPLTDPTYEYFKYWVADVPSTTGIFYYNGTDRTRGESAIPEGWEVKPFER